MHPGRQEYGRVGGKLPRAPQQLGTQPVEYRKFETHF